MYTMRKVKESKKDKKLNKQKRIIKEKQKEKQREKHQISIVINSNNRNKKTSSAPKQSQQPQPMPQQSRSNNPPVVNVMGDTRPQVTASGNFSGLGQQNRINSMDSAVEQRLTRLEQWENDSSSNSLPARSNEKVLKPEIKREKEITKAPDSYKKEDFNFFNPAAQEEEKEQDVNNDDKDDNFQYTNDENIGTSEPPDYEPPSQSLKDKFISLFTPKRNELVTVPPERGVSLTAVALAQRNLNTQMQTEYLEIPWKKMGRPEKRQWALENASGYESAAVINKMQLKDLDVIRAKVLSQRKA